MKKEEIYVSKENVSVCEMCGKNRDLRFGFCWDCATAQNIIHIGQDMFGDDDQNAFKMPIKEVNERLKMLIAKGWKTGNDLPEIMCQKHGKVQSQNGECFQCPEPTPPNH